MIGEKRGFLLVIILLFSLFSFSGFAGWTEHCAAEQCVSIAVGVTSCPYCDVGPGAAGTAFVNCNDPEPGENEQGSCRSFAVAETGQIPLTVNEECVINAQVQPAAGGCWFFVGDYDEYDSDDCGVASVKPGSRWGNGAGPESKSITSLADDIAASGSNEKWLFDTLFIEDPWEYICTDTGFWARCDNDEHEGNKIVANGATYECRYNPAGIWEWTTDQDGDGYTTSEDCDDDVSDDYLAGRGVECPTLTAEDTPAGTTVEDIRKMARGACEANPGEFSQCAICINAGAAEVCGDGINNDCGGPGVKEKLDEEIGNTADSCHLNQASCEQDFVGHCSESNAVCSESILCEEGEECIMPTSSEEATGVCKYIGPELEEPSPKEGDSCTETSTCGDPEVWLCDKASTSAKNIYNEEFDWIEIEEGGSKSGYCCGYEGAKDAGVVKTDLDSQQSFVCLTDNKDFVSTEKDFEGNGIEEIFDNSGCGDKNWCWVDAAGANTLFKVFTIKRPGEIPFDAVSNADDWLICDAQAEKTFEASALAGGLEEELSNRFYCYQEGNRWAWAECTGDWEKRENPSVKGRYTGEGLYTLPLSILSPLDELPEEPTAEGDYLRESIIDKTIPIKYNAIYKKYYGKGFLDFTGYDYLNFMVRFVKDAEGSPVELKDLQLPLKIKLKLVGPEVNDEEVIYFEGNVLGYVINTPLSDLTTFMHVQVPIKDKDYKAIQGFTISSDSDNLIEVRNIYLTSDDAALPSQLCSGQDSAASSTWIQDADAGNPDQGITGENLCQTLYGEEAWLGEDQEVSEFEPAANCCGNAKNEYYAGLSTGYLPEGASTEELTYYGCWNSQTIASGDTVMDVEFEVESQETEFEVEYSPIDLPIITLHYRVFDEGSPDTTEDDVPLKEGTLKCNEEDLFPSKLEVGDTSTGLCSFIIPEDFGSELPMEYRGITKLWFTDSLSDNPNSPVELFFYDRVTDEPIGKEVQSATDPDDENFQLAGPAQYLSKEELLDVWAHPLSVVAKLKPNQFFPISNPSSSSTPVTQKVTYACSETECIFPLPGNAPYKVTNLHPDLYELYYVTGKLASDETPITQPDQEFSEYANLKVKRIAQQVLYYNEGEESTKDVGFYGCRAADFITHLDNEKNLQYCAVIGDKSCSFSEVHEEENNKDAFTIVNTWSEAGLTHVGYADPLQKPEDGQNISAYYETVELVLKEQIKSASSLNQSTSVVPARNFLPNTEFATSATKIPYWEVLVNTNQAVADEKSSFVKDNKVTLGNNQKLRSERISVPSSVDLYFSAAQECTTTIALVDKNGNSQFAALPQFNTSDASYVIVEFTGPCEVEKPSLQVVDVLGPAEYSYQSHPELGPLQDARSGAACCPNNYCWNGYACVEPMSSLTTVTEHIADGRDYRCIEGEWKRSVLKFDWNSQQWGFCPQENECFVLGSGKAENTAESFYDGEYPICISDSEYIFDNYCNQGNWTSRTKFLATKLLEVAENDEYVLYCSPYREALLDLGNNENYLGGEFLVTQKQQQTLQQSLQKPAQPQVLPTCFNNVKDPQGKRLVPDGQNTCINNVCVLQYKDGGQFKVAFATTLNKKINDPKSFLVSLNIPQEQLSQVCQGSGSDFIECNLQGLEFPSSADLYHSDGLNAIIFAREGIQLEPGVVDKIVKWFENLFGSGLLAEKTFVTQAQNFRNIYLADVDGKKVRAVEEIFPGVKQTLVAEYQNFDTPVCEYVKNIKVPPELQLELLEQASGIEKIHCAVNDTIQKVVINEGLEFFWPQMTAKLRIGESS
ncbi:MAG: hypothetical protein Q7S55_01670 [Nanoarchaeota archaeon]|nr:hypothetical protein [Nanoarchaeota archaeon]